QMENGEWKTVKTKARRQKVNNDGRVNGKWKMENGKWKMENGKWKMANSEQVTANCKL
ncbi:hypothetical protein PAXRUDRAFT_170366, partial [Paxillus rubicundulus Ve08.2h10]